MNGCHRLLKTCSIALWQQHYFSVITPFSTGATDPATTGRVNVRDLRDRRHFQTRGWLTLAAAPHVT